MAHSARRIALVGIGETRLGRVPDQSSWELYAQAAELALEDAGLTRREIDGILTCGSLVEPHPRHHIGLGEHLGIPVVRFSDTLHTGGAAAAAGLQLAAAAILAGLCETVLVAAADNLLSGLSREEGVAAMTLSHNPEFTIPYGPLIASLYACQARRHMEEYGTTSEQLAAVAVAARKHALLNPQAQQRTPLTVEEVLHSRMISSPLHLLDCAQVSDGGAAFLVTTAERARDLRQKPVYLLGAGQAHSAYDLTLIPSLTATDAGLAAEVAFRAAGVGREEIGFLQTYDCFTHAPIILLEDLGFCGKGEGGAFVSDGRIEPGGALPMNTHGGLLSCCHAGVTGGIFHLVEAVRQLRGQAGERQVPEARIGLVHGSGDLLTNHATVILAAE
ncbi:MAG: thiolase family protein [Candidatus Tectomicrobia bacterium]|uniref:Thiolase family protein n=1 Tax=Tectimicrobiota bacterium TaxID=2528274 RepID=A0A932FZQ8_UNCTE|nr:thiolase family protein [Candidatus Tectomicrobia bacterium]